MRYLLLRLKRFCGFITGFAFFIGGILKLLDPVGAGLVMDEYLDFMHLGFLGFMSKPLGAIFALAETVIGTGLITGVWRKVIGLAAVILQAFFTLLTLVLVIFNPEMDCGCFGEAIHLTHMQTFLKNIILMVLLLLYYIPTKMLGQPKKHKFVSFAIVSASALAFGIYSWMYIPLVDFTGYKPAAALSAGHAFASPEEDMYESVFVYEKDGITESFDIGHLPDSTWTFVSTETVRRDDTAKDTMIDLSISDSEGNYHDASATEKRVMVVSVYDIRIPDRRWAAMAAFLRNAQETGFTTLLLTAATKEQVDERLARLPAATAGTIESCMYHSDYKTLISMNRSNGGVTYFSDGYLIRKWAWRSAPDKDELIRIHDEDGTEAIIYQETKGSLGFQGFLLYVFAVMLLL